MFSAFKAFGFHLNFAVGVAHGGRHSRFTHHHYAFKHSLTADVGTFLFTFFLFFRHIQLFPKICNKIWFC